MKYNELMEEIKKAYAKYMTRSIFHKNVDFDSFLVGYTMCMDMRDTKRKEVTDENSKTLWYKRSGKILEY